MKLQAKLFSINIIPVYAPKLDFEDTEDEKIQERNNDVKQTKSDEVLCVIGDFNTKVGKEKYEKIAGTHGIDNRTKRGD